MCFSSTWSASSFWIIVVTATLAVVKGMDWRIPMALYFFAMKEAIQYFLYKNLSTCNRTNEILTTLSWVHISFHPFFVLLFIQAFSRRPEMYHIPLGMSLVYAVFNILRIHQRNIYDACVPRTSPNIGLCQKTTCSYPGKHHLAYGFKLQSGDSGAMTPNMFTYILLMLIVPLIVGDWPVPVANILLIILVYIIISPHNFGEASAIWCMFAFIFAGFVLWSLATGRKYYP